MEYGVADYGTMIADEVRTGAYVRALERVVSSDSVVLDIGAGTGIFALTAARLGARRVFAVEPDEVIVIAEEIARLNGLEGRIEFFREPSTDIDLPERADVIVSDLRGVLPLYDGHILAIVDARTRHLARGGVLIPQRDVLRVAVVEAPDFYRRKIECWDEHDYGFDMRPAREMVVNAWFSERPEDARQLSAAESWTVLEYRSIDDPSVTGEAELEIHESGTAHGLALWFESTLIDGIGYSTALSEPATVYKNAVLPLPEPVEVEPGDVVTAKLHASLPARDYVWRWETRIRPRRGVPKAEFTQSTVFAFPLSTRTLHRLAETSTPTASRDGEITAFVLARADGRRTLGELASELREALPDVAGSDGEALRVVTEIARKYCR